MRRCVPKDLPVRRRQHLRGSPWSTAKQIPGPRWTGVWPAKNRLAHLRSISRRHEL